MTNPQAQPLTLGTIRVWAVVVPNGLGTKIMGYFDSYETAKTALSYFPDGGTVLLCHTVKIEGRHFRIEVDPIQVHTSVDYARRHALREQALAKLGPEGCQALERLTADEREALLEDD